VKSLEFWVLAQLALDLGLLTLVFFFIFKIRALSRLLHASHPAGANHAEEITALSQKLTDLEQRFEAWANQPPGQISGFPKQFPPSESQDCDASFFTPEGDRGKSLRAQVEDLAGRGLSPEEIARHLRIQPAEVKVALDLSRILAK
jgi:hypothetical protein